MKSSFIRFLIRLPIAAALAALLTMVSMAVSVDQSAARADLQPAAQRKAAPAFALQDSAGKTATLDSYKGQVVLLDFWATWCHGCKEEIPWFAEFQRKYAPKGLQVVGVSMDDEWKVVHQFLANTDVPYRIVLGNDDISKKYGIENMPDTFLIDRQGRIAAVYRGLVDKNDVEKNLQAILSQ